MKKISDQNQPLVSIGMFVYNGEDQIREAIESVLNQTFEAFELIISDNASTDRTEEICREYATIDSRIKYIRQPINLGPTANCLVVLDEAVGEYFVWAAHDDIKSKDFIAANLNFLQHHHDYIASTSPIFFKGQLPNSEMMGDESLSQESPAERFLFCLNRWRGCGRFYSLFRRNVLLTSRVIRSKPYMGLDNAFILEMSIRGKFNRVKHGFLALGRNGVSSSGNIYSAYRASFIYWVIPLYEFSKEVLRLSSSFPLKVLIQVIATIFKMNFLSFLHQIKTEIKFYLNKNHS